VTSSRAKTAERQTALKKLLPLLKKHYKAALPKADRPVLDTMLYAVCLENASPQEADRCLAAFHEQFPDLNEARVSQVSELEPAFAGKADAEWRAFRLRAVLQFVFEKSFTFEFESLRKKTLELAVKQLAKLRHATPFIRNYTLQCALGAHILPIDDAMKRLLVWLGLASPAQSSEEIGEALKSSIRKTEAPTFCALLRLAATDERVTAHLPPLEEAPAEGYDAATAIERLQDLLSRRESKSPAKTKPSGKPPSPARKPPANRSDGKTTSVKRKSAKPAGRSR
jgi:endonuclease III